MVTFSVFVRLTNENKIIAKMTKTILNGVSKKMRTDFLNGRLSEKVLTKQYERNYQEAQDFSIFGYGMQELMEAKQETANPLLQLKLTHAIENFQNRQKKSAEQNKISLDKLRMFKESALGIGLRKVLSIMHKNCKQEPNGEMELVLLLLELEFANLSAKSGEYKRCEKSKIYERKGLLLRRVQPLLQKFGWRYGYNDASGKNASYIIYVYLPNGVQLSWHSNDYYLYKYYPEIDAEWDGQVCMTMEKLFNYINDTYFENFLLR